MRGGDIETQAEALLHAHQHSTAEAAPGIRGNAGTVLWSQLLTPKAGECGLADAFYFSVVTFLTIGYGDIAPASDTAKFFFIWYTVASLIVQLLVVGSLLGRAFSFTPPETERLPGGSQAVRHAPRIPPSSTCRLHAALQGDEGR
jgi:Ion channel